MWARAILFSLMIVQTVQADPAVTPSTQAPPPSAPQGQAQIRKPGDSLGTITTTDGKTYADAKLAVIEPDGISILYADGGTKIAFTSLSPEMQREFGYDPEKSSFYAREQQYLLQIDRLQTENAQLKKRLGLALDQQQTSERVANANPQGSEQHPTVAGYTFFLNDLENRSDRRHEPHGIIYRNGPLSGMTEAEAERYAQQQWVGLSYDQQMACEQKAKMFGEPPAQTQQQQPQQQTFQVQDSNGYHQVIVTPQQ